MRCDAGTPTPSSLYAFTARPGSTEPRFLQTLLAPPESQAQVEWFAAGFFISDNDVVLPARGVAEPAAICCPNVSEKMRWGAPGRALRASGRAGGQEMTVGIRTDSRRSRHEPATGQSFSEACARSARTLETTNLEISNVQDVFGRDTPGVHLQSSLRGCMLNPERPSWSPV